MRILPLAFLFLLRQAAHDVQAHAPAPEAPRQAARHVVRGQDGEEITIRLKYKEGEKERYSVDLREKSAITVNAGQKEWKETWSEERAAKLRVKCTKEKDDGTVELDVSTSDFEFKRELERPGDKASLHIKDGTVRLKTDRAGWLIDTDKGIGKDVAKKMLERLKLWDSQEKVTMTGQGFITPSVPEAFEGTIGDTLFPIALPPDGICVGDQWGREMKVHDFGLFFLPKATTFKAKYKIEKFDGKGFKREAVISLTFDVDVDEQDAEVEMIPGEPIAIHITKLKLHVSTWTRIGVESGKMHASTLDASTISEFTMTHPTTKQKLKVKGDATVTGTILPD